MEVKKDFEIISPHYDQREHALIKHLILESYLEALFMIVGQRSPTIQFVDCFSGPWLSKDGDNLSDTSIGKSIGIMEKCLEEINSKHRKPGYPPLKARALFIENDPDAYAELSTFINKKQSCTPVELATINGDFTKVINPITEWLDSGFAFLFIDPKGWTGIEPDTLKPLLRRPHTELLINFMYDFINRFAKDQREKLSKQMDRLLGDRRHDLDGCKDSEQREEMLTRIYRDNLLKFCESKTWTAKMKILDPQKTRAKYHLIYLTHHPLGMKKFVEQTDKSDQIQHSIHHRLKAERKQEKTGMLDLFSDHIPDIESRPDNRSIISKYLIVRMSNLPYLVCNEQLMADILDHTDCSIQELQSTIKYLLDSGKIETNANYSRRKKHFIHFNKNEKIWRKGC